MLGEIAPCSVRAVCYRLFTMGRSRTLAPVLTDLRVTFRVFHGNCSTTVVHDIAAETQQTETPLVAFYVGDLDPSGAYMSDVDLPERLCRHGARNVTFQRLALTVADTQDLPDFEAKTTDTRQRWYVERYGRRCWELDAMSPAALRERVREAIKARIEPDSWTMRWLPNVRIAPRWKGCSRVGVMDSSPEQV